MRYVREYLAWSGAGKDGRRDSMTVYAVKSFLISLHEKNSAAQTINLYLNALRFFFREIVKPPLPLLIKSAKRPGRLPMILSHEEILRMLATTANKKHRLLLALAYGGGLRVSEVVHLRAHDINCVEKILFVRQGKGQRDRMSIIPSRIAAELADFMQYKQPHEYVFESGVDIRYVQELLGHKSILTTQRYTHVAKHIMQKIKSPLD